MNLLLYNSPDPIHLTSARRRISHQYLSISILSCPSFPVSRSRVLTFQVSTVSCCLASLRFLPVSDFSTQPQLLDWGHADLVWLGDVRAGMCSHYLTSYGLQSSSTLQPTCRHPSGRPYTLQGMWCIYDIRHLSSQGTSQGRGNQPEFSLQPATREHAQWLQLPRGDHREISGWSSVWEAVPAGTGFHLIEAALLSTPKGASLVLA